MVPSKAQVVRPVTEWVAPISVPPPTPLSNRPVPPASVNVSRREVWPPAKKRTVRYVRPICRVLVHLGRGETSRALDWLERAYDERDPWLPFLKIDPAFEPLRTEPRFVDLSERIEARRTGS